MIYFLGFCFCVWVRGIVRVAFDLVFGFISFSCFICSYDFIFFVFGLFVCKMGVTVVFF